MERVAVGDRVLAPALGEHVGVVVGCLKGNLPRHHPPAMRPAGEGSVRRRALDVADLRVLHAQRKITQQRVRDLLCAQAPSRDLGAHLREDAKPVPACGAKEPQRERKAVL